MPDTPSWFQQGGDDSSGWISSQPILAILLDYGVMPASEEFYYSLADQEPDPEDGD